MSYEHKSSDHQARQDQINYGKQMIKNEERKTLVFPKKPAPKHKPSERKITGHEAELNIAIKKGTEVEIVSIVGNPHVGRIVDADRYAIKVQSKEGFSVWIFKSFIGSFSIKAA